MTKASIVPRDPRSDPKPGDVMSRGAFERKVVEVAESYLKIQERYRNGVTRELYPRLGDWKRWAAKAQVIRLGC